MSYYRYDALDLLELVEALGRPIDAIHLTRCGGYSKPITAEAIRRRGKVVKGVWGKREPANRERLKREAHTSASTVPAVAKPHP